MKSKNINALKESEERLRLVFEHANDVIVIAQNEKVKYCNPQITKLTGYSLEEVYSMNFTEFIHPDDLKLVMREYKERLSGDKTKNRYSARIITKDDQEKFILVSSNFVNWDGEPATLATITDITQIKETELNLKRSEERFRQLMEQSPLAMEILSPDGKINLVNTAWRKMWQVTEEEAALTIEKYNMLKDPQLVKLGIMDQVQDAFKGKHIILPPIKYDTSETKDDFDLDILQELRSPWIQCHLNSVKDAEGNIIYVVNTYVDITDFKEAEEILGKSEERYRHLMEHSPLSIAIFTKEGKLKQINTAWKNLWGVSEEEAVQVMENYNIFTDKQMEDYGYAPLVVRAFTGEDIILPPMKYEASRTTKEIVLEDIKALTRWIQSHLYSVKDANGEIDYIININMDLTELIEAEKEAERQRDVLARIDRTSIMGQLTGSIAHELNQPLT